MKNGQRFDFILYEKTLENYAFERMTESGFMVITPNPTGNAGIPDLLVLHNGRAWFVELKMPKGVVHPRQKEYHRRLTRHGFTVQIVRTKEDVENLIIEIESSIE